MSTPNWPALRAAEAREAWQAAYAAAGLCGGRGDTAWREAAEHIEAHKARALAALTEAWRQRKGKP